MMIKAFIFLMIIWNSFASKSNTYNLQFSLGCQAKIPCQHDKSNSNSFKWFYKKDEHAEKIQIHFKDKTGVEYHNAFHRRGSVTRDRALVIDTFTEDDQGLYWCQNCYGDMCKSEQSIVVRVTKEIHNDIIGTVYVTAGSSFTYSCPSELTHFKWTFAANYTTLRNSAATRPKTDVVTFNKSLHIAIVKTADAGKYTCWTNKCGHTQKIYTVNLCVITVNSSWNSSVSCTVTCDVDLSYIKLNSTSNEATGTRTIAVNVTPHGSLNCSAKQMFDVYSTTNSTHAPSNTSITTKGTNTQPGYLKPVIYGTSAALTCLILLALLIFYLSLRIKRDVSHNPSGCNIDAMQVAAMRLKAGC
ncbi:mediator of RNA polymerase II transcription subunit 18 isoform X2 [Anabas testudineus]|uniref:mediator of RNA polymerase II transcription subunit 18 isoform X2 n=1 Tax=Anabas testudineus TaxID=64144 RepID=UPI000E45AA93|nr:mediator of RNA polymerase II transcription subunit 18 isoform X2 [Anabas testudineus]